MFINEGLCEGNYLAQIYWRVCMWHSVPLGNVAL